MGRRASAAPRPARDRPNALRTADRPNALRTADRPRALGAVDRPPALRAANRQRALAAGVDRCRRLRGLRPRRRGARRPRRRPRSIRSPTSAPRAAPTATPRETAAWRGSDHDRAMEEPTRACSATSRTRASSRTAPSPPSSSATAASFVRTQGRGRSAARTSRSRTRFGVDPLQQLLLPLPGGRLQALERRLGRAAARGRRPALVLAVPGRGDPAGRRAALDAALAELERRLRRVPLDEPAQAATTSRSDALSRRPGRTSTWRARPATAPARGTWRGRRRGARGPATAASPSDSATSRARWVLARGRARSRGASRALRGAHASSRSARPATRGARCCARAAAPGEPFLDTHRPALLEAGLYRRTARSRARSTSTAPSCRAACTRRASRAATATIRTASRCAPRATRCAGSATGPRRLRRAGAPSPCGRLGRARDCAACHMPARTYMGVDVRHDHSFRVPRPDLSVALGTPNACTDCHAERTARWAAAAVRALVPEPAAAARRTSRPHSHAGRDGTARRRAGAAGARRRRRAARHRARHRAHAARGPGSAGDRRRDPPRARRRAIRWCGSARSWPRTGLEPSARLAAVQPLLEDPLLAVRSRRRARARGRAAASLCSPPERSRLAAALAEYRARSSVNADRPEAHVNLGGLAALQGDLDAARARVPDRAPPRAVVRAGLREPRGPRAQRGPRGRRRGGAAARRCVVGARAGRAALRARPAAVRTGRRDEALAELARAAALAPDNPRFVQALALALEDRGEHERAHATLEAALARRPGDRELRADGRLPRARAGAARTRAAPRARTRRSLARRPARPRARGEPRP